MKSNGLYFRLLRYVQPHRKVFGLALIGMALEASTVPLVPILLKPLLESMFSDPNPSFVRIAPVLLIGIFLLRGVAGFVNSASMNWVATRVLMDLRNEMVDRLLILPTRYYDEHSTGSLLSKLTFDVNQAMGACSLVTVTLVRDSLAIIGLLVWIAYLDWQLSFAALIIAPIAAVGIRAIANRLRRLARELQNSMGALTHVVEEVLVGHKVIKVSDGQEYESRRFRKVNNWVRQLQMKVAVASGISVSAAQLIAAIAMAIVIYRASIQSAASDLSLGEYASLFAAMAMLMAPIKRLTRLNEDIQKARAAAESIFALLDETPESGAGTNKVRRGSGIIEFDNVTFQYERGMHATLRNVNLQISAGETVALVGPSGGGKTTLVSLIPRFYEPSDGRILLDGRNVADITLGSLRSNIAFVSQDTVLFNDTVAANIAYGSASGASQDEIIIAAQNACAMEFIERLPDGLATIIGENGARLSGGQRQRIAIARALLRNAPLLILDEATSSLDSESEHKIQEALEVLRHGCTALIVAHRLSTIENADRIVVMDRGRIVESGSHAELLGKQSSYIDLYHPENRSD